MYTRPESKLPVAVMGAGIAGLSTSLSLARRGHRVVLLEQDAAAFSGDPRSAFEGWLRPGVSQFRQPHCILGAGRRMLREHAPDVYERLLRAGAVEVDQRALLPEPPETADDEDLAVLACRRPVFEAVLRSAVSAEPRVEIAAGTRAVGLCVEQSAGRSRATGVRLDGSELDAALVVDGLGRGSPAVEWLTRAGVELPPARISDCGVVYYSRHFRTRANGTPQRGRYLFGGPRGLLPGLAFAIFLGDGDTFSLTLMAAAGDAELKALRRSGPFMAAAAAIPEIEEWTHPDRAEPISGVLAMGALRNVLRPIAAGGRPLVDGYRPIGDAWVHTNPTFAFGVSLALTHGFSLAALVDRDGDPATVGQTFEAAHATDVGQRWAAVTAEDRDRTRWWSGEPIDPLDPASSMPLFLRSVVYPVAGHDPEILRRVARRVDALDPVDALERDAALIDRARRIHHRLTATGQVSRAPGPDRAQLLAKIASAPAPAAVAAR